MTEVLKISHQLLPAQQKLIEETRPYIAIIGGARSGKTRGGALKALQFCVKYPGIFGMVTGPSYKVMGSATIPTYETVFTKDILLSINHTDMFADIIGGGKLFFRTTKDPYDLRGTGLGFFHMDEGAESPALAFKILQARLSQPNTPRQGWVTTTPRGFNWLYNEFGAQERDNYVVIHAKTMDNSFLLEESPDYVDRLTESYTDEQFLLQELEGQFIEVGGQCPFDMKALNQMYQEAKQREEIERELGFIYTYSKRQIAKRYVFGGDAGTGEGSDDTAFVGALASPVGLEEVCSGKGKMPEAEFADILARKSEEYNKGMVVVEDAPVGKATLIKLKELHCNIYKRKGDKAGWPCLPTTKPMMVADLADMIRDRTLVIHNLDIIEQLMSYVRDEKGKYHATGGAHDDYVSALMVLIQGMKAIPISVPISITYPKTWHGGK